MPSQNSSTSPAPIANPFDIERDEGTFFIIDARDGTTADFADSRDEAQAKADRFWYDELRAAPVVVEESASDPQTERDTETLARDGLRLASQDEPGWSHRTRDGRWLWVTDAPDETPSPPAITASRIALPGGAWALLDGRGSLIGIERAVEAA